MLFTLSELWVGSHEHLLARVCRELPEGSNNDDSLEWWFWGALKLSVFSSDRWVASFHYDCGTVVFKATLELGVGDGIGQFKMLQGWLVLPRFSSFSWIHTPWIAASPWLISRVLEKVIFTIFLISLCIYGKADFQGPYSILPAASCLPAVSFILLLQYLLECRR